MPPRERVKIGRNDPCRCGSGKKYKHCCLPGYAPSIDNLWARQHEESDRLTRAMRRIAAHQFGAPIYEARHDCNMSVVPKPLEECSAERQILMPYVLYQWYPDVSRRR